VKCRFQGLRWPWQLIVCIVCALAVFSRRPDAFLNPQFFAEDGNIWFADAYNFGWLQALLITHTGYFQTLPRLAASLGLAVPLIHAPLVMNAIGLILQIAPAIVLLSYRTQMWAPLRIRALMAMAYIALPNTSELNVSITEAQWHLALITCLLVLSVPPRTRAGYLMDLAIVALCGLTGPFCIVLFPAAAAMWWRGRERWRLVLTSILGGTALLQGVSIVHSALQTRATMPLGASFNLLWRMVVAQIYLGPLLGINGALRRGDLYIYSMAVLGTAILGYCCLRARWEWKLFVGFAVLIFAASMISPQASYDRPQWVALAGAWGTRYWFFPALAFVWVLIWCAGVSCGQLARVVGLIGILMLCTRVKRNWRLVPYEDLQFARAVETKFDPAPRGAVVSLPIAPGGGWDMKLKKK
jgi:type IV secretory pathway VirB2 component (pilin)